MLNATQLHAARNKAFVAKSPINGNQVEFVEVGDRKLDGVSIIGQRCTLHVCLLLGEQLTGSGCVGEIHSWNASQGLPDVGQTPGTTQVIHPQGQPRAFSGGFHLLRLVVP